MALNLGANPGTIPALVATRIAAHGDEIILRKKNRGIWNSVTWSELGTRMRAVGMGLKAIGFRPGDVACVLAETRPEFAYVDLGILGAGGVSGGIHPEEEADALGETLRQSDCRVLFVENEEQLDKVLSVRDRCPALQRIVIFDMKGLRDFADPMCESFQLFVARGADHDRTHPDDWQNGIAAIASRTTSGSAAAACGRNGQGTRADAWRCAAPDCPRKDVAGTTGRRRTSGAAADVPHDRACVRTVSGAGRARGQQLPGKPRHRHGESARSAAHDVGHRPPGLGAAVRSGDECRRGRHPCATAVLSRGDRGGAAGWTIGAAGASVGAARGAAGTRAQPAAARLYRCRFRCRRRSNVGPWLLVSSSSRSTARRPGAPNWTRAIAP